MDNLFFLEAKCVKTRKTFYIRFDKAAGGVWCQTYGVKIKPQNINHSYNTTKIDVSNATVGPQYSCPHCGNDNYIQCGSCGKITCFKYGDKDFSCAHCGNQGAVSYDSYITTIEGNGGVGQG